LEHDWNWKVMVENFMESYHHMGTHADTLQPIVPASGTFVEDSDGPYAVLHNPSRDGAPLPVAFPSTPGLSESQRADFIVCAVFPCTLLSVLQAGLRSRLAEPARCSHLEKALWQLQRFLLERVPDV
jgi:phenylpropionate dioxygenase-like ring-hydroxylating dioxygenase large terminal subunit